MYYARPPIKLIKKRTPVLLSALELPSYALESSTLVGILTMSKDLTEKMLVDHPGRSRLRIVGVSDQPTWGASLETGT